MSIPNRLEKDFSNNKKDYYVNGASIEDEKFESRLDNKLSKWEKSKLKLTKSPNNEDLLITQQKSDKKPKVLPYQTKRNSVLNRNKLTMSTCNSKVSRNHYLK